MDKEMLLKMFISILENDLNYEDGKISISKELALNIIDLLKEFIK